MSNISNRMKNNMYILKSNEKIDRYVIEHPTKKCDTCNREKETSLFVITPYSTSYPKKRMMSTCPDCIRYKDLTTSDSYCNLKDHFDCLYLDTTKILNHYEFLIKYEKENNIKPKIERDIERIKYIQYIIKDTMKKQ